MLFSRIIGNPQEIEISYGFDLSKTIYRYRNASPAIDALSLFHCFVKPDGSNFYLLNYNDSEVVQFTTSTSWYIVDLTSVGSKVLNLDYSYCQTLFISPSGDNLYTSDFINQRLYQFSLSTPWDITTTSASPVATFDITDEESKIRAIWFKPDGAKIFILQSEYYSNSYHNYIYSYTLSTPWDVSTINTPVYYDVGGVIDNNMVGIWINPVGDFMLLYGLEEDSLFEFSLSTPWDITTSSYNSVSYNIADTFNVERGFFGSNEHLYFFDSTGALFQFSWNNLSCTDVDISRIYYTGYKPVSMPSGDEKDFYFKPDGTKCYFLTNFSDYIYEYDLLKNWEVTSESLNHVYTKSLSLAGGDSARSFDISPDGVYVYVQTVNTDRIYQFEMTTPWDISTLTSVANYVTSPPTGNPFTIRVSSSGDSIYVYNSGKIVYQFSLSVPWDVTSITGYTSKSIDPSWGFTFSSDGSKLFTADNMETVYQFSLSTPWDITTVGSSDGNYVMPGNLNNGPMRLHEDVCRLYVMEKYSSMKIYYLSFLPA